VGAQKFIGCLGLDFSLVGGVGHRQQAARQGGPILYNISRSRGDARRGEEQGLKAV
jgi:hypothetical protein